MSINPTEFTLKVKDDTENIDGKLT